MDSVQDLLEQLQTGDESVRLEAKTAEEIGKSILETISAFSNEPGLGGGYLVLGVKKQLTDDNAPLYEIVGIKNADKIQTELATQCSDKTFSSALRPLIRVDQIDGKTVIAVFIPEAPAHDKPVYIRSKGVPSGAFRRIGSADVVCTSDDLELLFSLRSNKSFDATPVDDAALDDFDPRAIAEYRRVRGDLNPGAMELEFDDADMLYALGATTKALGGLPTLAGMLLFGRGAALRRLFPMTRVDYIRVQGREWVPDPDERFETLDFRGPLMLLVRRVVAQILDDIPKAVTVDALHRREVSALPLVVVREAVVNALMHRNYRVNQPVQIIRYSNRLEIRNAGYSLKPEEQLGVPGSVPRNPKIAEVLHEAGLAETKGSGIRAMRERMRKANLTLPAFESDRERDQFTLTLLLHNLSNPDDLLWLEQFKTFGLAPEYVQALLFVREVGAISNADYRNINTVETLVASKGLQRLRDWGLLEQHGKSTATYYTLTDKVLGDEGVTPLFEDDFVNPSLESAPSGLNPRHNPTNPRHKDVSGELTSLENPLPELPPKLQMLIQKLGKRSDPDAVQTVILELCRWHALRPMQLGALLGRNTEHLQRRYLKPMQQRGLLEYTRPNVPAHPQQAYRAKG